MRRALVVLVSVLACVVACGPPPSAGRIGPQGRTVTRLDPVNPKAQKEFEGAMRALRLGGPEAGETAKARLKAALAIDSKIWEAWHDLGVIAYKDGDDEAAIGDFSKALEIKKNHTPTLLARAEANRRAGRKADARADYEAALRNTEEDDPLRKDGAARLASLLRDAGDFDDAVNVLRETVKQSGSSAKIYTELGLIYLQQKRYDLAQLVLAKAVELDDAAAKDNANAKKDPAIYNALAMLSHRQGRAQEAFERFDFAASLDANYIDARFNKASVLLDAGDHARAKVELVAIVEKRPDDYAAHVALGVAQRGLKDYTHARKTWDLVINNAPRRSSIRGDALFNLGILKIYFLNDAVAGKKDLERYLQEAPGNHAKRQAAQEELK
jgi:tetratricopeptide (TPR) repeat protein